jgi:hypothetical protein
MRRQRTRAGPRRCPPSPCCGPRLWRRPRIRMPSRPTSRRPSLLWLRRLALGLRTEHLAGSMSAAPRTRRPASSLRRHLRRRPMPGTSSCRRRRQKTRLRRLHQLRRRPLRWKPRRGGPHRYRSTVRGPLGLWRLGREPTRMDHGRGCFFPLGQHSAHVPTASVRPGRSEGLGAPQPSVSTFAPPPLATPERLPSALPAAVAGPSPITPEAPSQHTVFEADLGGAGGGATPTSQEQVAGTEEGRATGDSGGAVAPHTTGDGAAGPSAEREEGPPGREAQQVTPPRAPGPLTYDLSSREGRLAFFCDDAASEHLAEEGRMQIPGELPANEAALRRAPPADDARRGKSRRPLTEVSGALEAAAMEARRQHRQKARELSREKLLLQKRRDADDVASSPDDAGAADAEAATGSAAGTAAAAPERALLPSLGERRMPERQPITDVTQLVVRAARDSRKSQLRLQRDEDKQSCISRARSAARSATRSASRSASPRSPTLLYTSRPSSASVAAPSEGNAGRRLDEVFRAHRPARARSRSGPR